MSLGLNQLDNTLKFYLNIIMMKNLLLRNGRQTSVTTTAMQLALHPILGYSEALERRAAWISEKTETANNIIYILYKSLPSHSQSRQWISSLVVFLLCRQSIPYVRHFLVTDFSLFIYVSVFVCVYVYLSLYIYKCNIKTVNTNI